MLEKFEMTSEGHSKALTFLEDLGELEKIDKELSRDGFTVVHLANSFLVKMAKENYEDRNKQST